jgi:hypothetical protein
MYAFRGNRHYLLADSFAISFLKFTKSCKNASKNEMYLQEIYQSSKYLIKKCLLFRCRHAVVIMQTLNWTNHSVRYSWQSAIFLRSVRMTTTELYYITGGRARHEKVSPKTWRIFPPYDAISMTTGSSGSLNYHWPGSILSPLRFHTPLAKIRYYKDVTLCENYVRDFFIAAILPVSVKFNAINL